jgi:hypothetical protein
MPDAIEQARTDTEEGLKALLLASNEARREELLRAIDTYGSVSGIPESFWERWKRETDEQAASLMLLLLMGTYRNESRSIERTLPREALGDLTSTLPVGTAADADRLRNAASGPAAALGRETAIQHVEGIRDRLQRAIDQKADELNRLPVVDARAKVSEVVDESLGETQAERAAIDNTTRGISAGQDSAKRDIQNATGLVIDQAWRTSKDNRVCPICQPLDGRPSVEWQDRFPQGPPAHPRCRCRLVNFYRGRGAERN